MECVNSFTIHKKRRLEDIGTWGSCQPKRVCGGDGVCDQMTVCPMETWSFDTTPQQHHQQQQQQMAPAETDTSVASLLDDSMVYPIQACPRCLSGEPGHINHIRGY